MSWWLEDVSTVDFLLVGAAVLAVVFGLALRVWR